MDFKRNLVPYLYLPLRAIHLARSLISQDKNTRLRVLLFHDIPKDSHGLFQQKLEFLSKRWNFIRVQDFGDYLEGKTMLRGDNLLLSFDDGFRSNRLVAEEILNPMGIKALFFVVSEFINLTNQEDQIKFIKTNLYPQCRDQELPENLSEMKSLSYEDLSYLIDAGHTIGCHTATHSDLSKITDKKHLTHEIVDSANSLEKELGIKIEHFSFGFGNVSFFNKSALQIARSRFPYVYTGMRGDNARSMNPWAIRRDTIAIDDSFHLMGSLLEGVADFRYKKDLNTYESWSP